MCIVFYSTLAAIAAFQLHIYGGASWHVGVIYVLFLAWYIINFIFSFMSLSAEHCFCCAPLGGLCQACRMAFVPYSSSMDRARMIKTLELEHAVWGSYPDFTGTAIIWCAE